MIAQAALHPQVEIPAKVVKNDREGTEGLVIWYSIKQNQKKPESIQCQNPIF